MKYLLEDIELWVYDFEKYPLLERDVFLNKYIGKKYDFEFFGEIEDEIKKYLVKCGFFVIDIMNPFYADSAKTVITFDLSVKKQQVFLSREENSCCLEINKLMKKHDKLSKRILKNGGILAMEKKDGCYFSKDASLYKIEKEIKKNVQNNFLKIIIFLQNYYSLDLLKALQWVPKNDKLLELLVTKIRAGDEEEKNSCLFQLMPIVDVLDVVLQKRLFDLFVSETLLAPTSKVRNKVFSLIMKMPVEIISTASNNFQEFLRTNATSKQLNCSYPAREIIKILGS